MITGGETAGDQEGLDDHGQWKALSFQPSTLPPPTGKAARGRRPELIEGEAQVHFSPGQKEAVVHLSFCPPFPVVPEVHGEDALGDDLEIERSVHTFGARYTSAS